jgi:hypothetical protein
VRYKESTITIIAMGDEEPTVVSLPPAIDADGKPYDGYSTTGHNATSFVLQVQQDGAPKEARPWNIARENASRFVIVEGKPRVFAA